MKSHFVIIFLIFFSLMIYSCKKDNNDPIIEEECPVYLNYSNLKVGNYWIYQRFNVDFQGNATPINTYDSCYIEKDTIINNNKYFKLVKPYLYSTVLKENIYLRDSLHYIVNSMGEVLFSYEDFSNILDSSYIVTGPNDTISQIKKQMTDKDISVITPAGTFVSSNAKETFYMYPNYSFNGVYRYINNIYSENVGIIIETLPFFLLSTQYTERRLVRYHFE